MKKHTRSQFLVASSAFLTLVAQGVVWAAEALYPSNSRYPSNSLYPR